MNHSNLSSNTRGIIFTHNNGVYTVFTGITALTCKLKGNLHQQFSGAALAVGDHVMIDQISIDRGIIVDLLPRHNLISRRAAGVKPGALPAEQTIAANLDMVVPVFSAVHPAPKWGLLDRYLVSAESSDIPVLICITKIDLANHALRTEIEERLLAYGKIGYRFIITSTADLTGIEILQQELKGFVSVLMGKSGVGKTSLINALLPDSNQRVAAVSSVTNKGKHTTTQSQMIPLLDGGFLIDTPGIREFGLWGIGNDDLADYFPEMRPYLGLCKFRANCQHIEEPGCAIRQAVIQGKISPYRYQSFQRLKEDGYFS